ncbi:MAG: hypothetical protein HY078_01520 [Elusimicrobia bacterium]|nr:hypothetical protein [Elusimicrobiota bacterium]
MGRRRTSPLAAAALGALAAVAAAMSGARPVEARLGADIVVVPQNRRGTAARVPVTGAAAEVPGIGAAAAAGSAVDVGALRVNSGIPFPAVIAHRGSSGVEPENSASSFERALAQGADYLELDLHLSKDGVLVVNHDESFWRTTDVARVFPDRNPFSAVQTFTWAEVQRLTLDPGAAQRAGQRVLRLEQVIDIARKAGRPVGLYVEAKNKGAHARLIAATAVKTLKEQGWIRGDASDAGRIVFEAFDLSVVGTFKREAPSVPAAYLLSYFLTRGGWLDAIREAKAAGGDILAPGTLARYPDAELIEEAHAQGLLVHPWTVDDPEGIRTLLESGADGIISNFPDRVRGAATRLGARPR